MTYKIAYPQRKSEAEIEASLWSTLQHYKIDARLQVSGYAPNTSRRTRRLDVVVFKEQEPVCIIECKSWSDNYTRVARYQRVKNSKQIKRYEALYGLPVLICARQSFIKQIVASVRSLLDKGQI